jgi:DNA polymerase III alpha subunit
VNINLYGQVQVTEQEAFDALYSGQTNLFDSLYIDDATAVEKFNLSVKNNADSISKIQTLVEPAVPIDIFDKANQNNWFMPEEYKNMDIEGFLVSRCPKQNYERLIEELDLFRQHGMYELLHYLKYLVDTMRENKIVWGVGRGSSVASYVLYLIGIHKVDSIKYELDIREFLR